MSIDFQKNTKKNKTIYIIKNSFENECIFDISIVNIKFNILDENNQKMDAEFISYTINTNESNMLPILLKKNKETQVKLTFIIEHPKRYHSEFSGNIVLGIGFKHVYCECEIKISES